MTNVNPYILTKSSTPMFQSWDTDWVGLVLLAWCL